MLIFLANFAKFNSLYAITIDEEQLRIDKYCSGKCDSIDSIGMKSAQNLFYPNQCSGSLRFCWLEKVSSYQSIYKIIINNIQIITIKLWEINKVTEKRKKANKDYKISMETLYFDSIWIPINFKFERTLELLKILHHTGNICKCLCERDDHSNTKNERGELLDSICFDPVSVDDG